MRLAPLCPFNWLNCALGPTRNRFLTYLPATWTVMLPGAFTCPWRGQPGRVALSGGDGLVCNLAIALSLRAAVALLPRRLRRLLAGPMPEVPDQKRPLDAGEDGCSANGLPGCRDKRKPSIR